MGSGCNLISALDAWIELPIFSSLCGSKRYRLLAARPLVGESNAMIRFSLVLPEVGSAIYLELPWTLRLGSGAPLPCTGMLNPASIGSTQMVRPRLSCSAFAPGR